MTIRDASPSPSGPPPDDVPPRLDERQEAVRRALHRVDPHLAGLFEEAVRLGTELERPGRIVMLSHAVRELGNGLGRHLSGLGFPPTYEELEDAKQVGEGEAHRVIIAKALGRDPDHPSVTAWFKAHKAFQRTFHYWYPLPAAPHAAEAFRRFTEILWALFGPFFDTLDDLEPLLAAETPTPEQVETLHRVLLRPAQRAQFFQRLSRPGWVEPLRAAGLFRPAPPAVEVDGKGRWDPWPEGDYLRRVAAQAPSDVERVLLDLPPGCTNPLVWHRAIEAAMELPVEPVGRLVPRFASVGESGAFRRIFADTLGRLALRLAVEKHRGAFPLTRALLHVEETTPPEHSPLLYSTTGKRARVGALSEYEFEEFLPKLAAALEALDVEQALQCLCHLLAEVLQIEFASGPDGGRDDHSTRWCQDLAHTDDRENDAREILAVAIAGVAARWATTGAQGVACVLEILRKQQWPVFRRLELYALAHGGAQPRGELDGVIGDASAVAAEYPPPEYALVVERQFGNASPEAQARHVEAVQRGPGAPHELRATLQNLDDSPLTDDDIERYIVRWQRKRLRRFGASVPPALQPLADALTYHPRVPPPTADDIELEDQGSLGGRTFTWSGPTSPLSEAEIAARPPEELIGLFQTFQPTERGWDEPTPAGFARALTAAVATDPKLGCRLACLLPAASPQPTYVRGVMEGLLKAAEAGPPVPMKELLPVIRWVATQPRGPDPTRPDYFDCADANWDEAKRQAARLLMTGAQKKLLAPSDRAAAWDAVEAFLTNAATWEGFAKTRGDRVETVDAALMVALNHLGGDVVRALAEVALWTYRLDERHFDLAHLRVGLDAVLSQTGRESVGARTMLGKYLPWLLLMDQEGVLARTSQLFAGGFAPPATNAVWGGYITNKQFFASTFTALRPWYIAAAQALPIDRSGGAEPDRTWSPTRHLVRNAVIAMLQGLVTPEDADAFLTTVFGRAPVTDLSHTYWEVFRSWSDRREAPPPAAVERLLRLWAWRLDALEVMPESSTRQEEAGALGWLSLIPWLSDVEVLPLLGRTAVIAQGHFPMDHAMWVRLAGLTALDAPGGFAIAERIIAAVLRSEYPYFDAEQVTPVLRRALATPDRETRHRARDLVHLLGERGSEQFRGLLDEAGE